MSQIRPIAPTTGGWEAAKATLAAPAIIMAISGPPALLRAALITVLWRAYMIPAGLPELRLVTAFGAVLMVDALGVRNPSMASRKTLWAIYLDRAMEAIVLMVLGLAGWLFI